MFRKKAVVLTASRCQLIETVRLALEVLTGERVRLHQLDFNQDNYFFRFGQVIRRVSFSENHNGRYMDIGVADDQGKLAWYTARFEEDDQMIRVISTYGISDNPMWEVGRSYHDRWQEPLYPTR
ncbi:MAG: hypothetical protein QG664_311 [Patescibacteria group bacterium]|nr:hypothetical protein [Patescibacteria group bacterium]